VNYFVPATQAIEIIFRAVKSAPIVETGIESAFGLVLAETIKSPCHSPLFDQSAMDGYAFRHVNTNKGKKLIIAGESAAGRNFPGKWKKGQAIRIFTGAAVPSGCDSVVMQEKVTVTDKSLKFKEIPSQGSNIRKAGSQIKKGATAAIKGTFLNPGAVGFLATLGIEKLKVFKIPKVAVIVTGNELIPPGKKLLPGQIFESNSIALRSLLSGDGIQQVEIFKSMDSLKSIRKAFSRASELNDFILFTGGISVGDYDFVSKVMEEEKVKTLFYKVKQKPGKPLYFGTKKHKYIFGLPGNPASVLSCYYEYVSPALKKFQNHPHPLPQTFQLPVTSSINKKAGLTQFLKAYTDFKTVTPLQGQESYILKSFITANCFIILTEESEGAEAGKPVRVHLI